jgi:hypothetical protein
MSPQDLWEKELIRTEAKRKRGWNKGGENVFMKIIMCMKKDKNEESYYKN